MSRNRFQAILRFWHCNDNSKEPARDDPNRDRLYKIRPLVKRLQEFQSVYTLDKYIAIDESLLLWKGQLVFKQYIPLKRARFGIRIIKSLLNKGYYHLFMDNWYSGVRLYQYMKTKGTVCCGTLRENRAPAEVRQLVVSHADPVKAMRSGPLLFIKWQSSKVVYMLSAMHDETMRRVERRGRNVSKPSWVADYNSKMGAVNRAD
ncbi:hypothetical protein ACOMHN_022541 [Nucella lapillus]